LTPRRVTPHECTATALKATWHCCSLQI